MGVRTWLLEPGGKDDFHDIWIDPTDSDRMIAVHDGGFQVTLTGGLTRSDFANQNGTQFYRVDTDNQFPYRVYGNSQDLLVYSVPSASFFGGHPTSRNGFSWERRETSSVIPHPENPDITYSLATGAFYGAAAHFTVNNRGDGNF